MSGVPMWHNDDPTDIEDDPRESCGWESLGLAVAVVAGAVALLIRLL